MPDPYDAVFADWLRQAQQRPDVTTTKRPAMPVKRTIGPQPTKSRLPAVPQPSTARRVVDGVASVLPGTGEIMSAFDAGGELAKGHFGSAALAAAGALPIVGRMGKPGRKIVTAAMRDPETGKIFTGAIHWNAIDSAPKGDGVWARLSDEWDRDTHNVGFLDDAGNFLTRDEAHKLTGEYEAREIYKAQQRKGPR